VRKEEDDEQELILDSDSDEATFKTC